ncbi:type I-E CRISPR-associated protein Cas6/Cse3/CasE [Phenylobacterium sp.]|uniref:type I-E CRISPR-associated protein Cas6/Cse3/CasE n=1 Tax=Phenylobacterium sp. TaxID=1871053 RepID=UPI00301D5137
MTWITHAELRRDTPQARQLAACLVQGSGSAGHNLVWNLFADDPDATRDFLYREIAPGRFIVVSARPPAGLPEVWTMTSKPYAPRISAGDDFAFMLRAQPTVALSQPGRARSLRRDVFIHAKKRKGGPLSACERQAVALEWLFAREDRLGVAFDRERCGMMRDDTLTPKPATAPRARMQVADFEGRLSVRDPARLTAALTAGVGPGKAYGLGLLLLKPAG